MEQTIKNILADLYKIDGNLANYEQDLVKIIEDLLRAQPEANFDEVFKENLKKEVMAKIAELKADKTATTGKAEILRGAFFNRFGYAFMGAALVLIITLPLLLSRNFGDKASDGTDINFNQNISKLGKRAFGELSTQTVADGGKAVNEAALGLGGGGGGVASVDMDTAAQRSMIAPGEYYPGMINYEYVYAGEEFTLSESEVEVLCRVKNISAAKSFSDIFNNTRIDLLDLSKFQNTELVNISVNENREFGYSYSLNFAEGVSIYANWEKWPHPEQNCRDEACYAQYRLKESDIPADAEIIAFADAFARDYGIDLGRYGQGEVQDYWREQRYISESEIYIPDEVSVLYPLLINGKEVYENGGNKVGLNINVNIRHKKAAGAYSLIAQNYESSSYEAVINTEDVLNFVKKGGMQYLYAYEKPDETVQVELDTPYLAMLKHYNYQMEKGQSEELYIPALVFPVKNISNDKINYYQKAVIAPLAKEIFDQYLRERDNIIQPIIMRDIDSAPQPADAVRDDILINESGQDETDVPVLEVPNDLINQETAPDKENSISELETATKAQILAE